MHVRPTALLAMLLAGLMLVSGAIVGTSPAGAAAQTVRILGDTVPPPGELALTVQDASGVARSPEVLIASDSSFADALASGVLQDESPLLLVPTAGPVPLAVRERIVALGAGRAMILGGTAAVSAAVAQELDGMGLNVQRIAGATRIDTAVAIARAGAPDATTAILARASAPTPAGQTPVASRAFADALAAGAVAAREGWPVLLTDAGGLSSGTRSFIAEGVQRVVVVGGTAAVPASIEDDLRGMGLQVDRAAGDSRDATAVALADLTLPATPRQVVIVESTADQAWAGGFTAAGYAADRDAPILLTAGSTVSPATAAYIAAAQPAVGDEGLILHCVVTVDVCDAASEVDEQRPQRLVSERLTLPGSVSFQVTGGTWVAVGFTVDGESPSSAGISFFAADGTRVETVSVASNGGGGTGSAVRLPAAGTYTAEVTFSGDPRDALVEVITPTPATGRDQPWEFGPAGVLLSLDVPAGQMFTAGWHARTDGTGSCSLVRAWSDAGERIDSHPGCFSIAEGGFSSPAFHAATGGRQIVQISLDGAATGQGVVQGMAASLLSDGADTPVRIGAAGVLVQLDLAAGEWIAGGARGVLDREDGCARLFVFGPDGERRMDSVDCAAVEQMGTSVRATRALTDGLHTVQLAFGGSASGNGVAEVTTPVLLDGPGTTDQPFGPAGLLVTVPARAGDVISSSFSGRVDPAPTSRCGRVSIYGLDEDRLLDSLDCSMDDDQAFDRKEAEVPTDGDFPVHYRMDGATDGQVQLMVGRTT